MRWKSVGVLGPADSRRIYEGPVLRRRVIDSRFCYRSKNAGKDPEVLRKLGEPPVRAKARLVIQGFKDPGRRRLRKDSPTASRQAVQVLLQVVTSLGWDLQAADASSAFMQGGADESRELPIYMRPPRSGRLHDVRSGALIQVIGSVYGLVNSPRLWYRVLVGHLVSSQWMVHTMDPSFLVHYDDHHGLDGVMVIHVDDIMLGVANETLLTPLKERFAWGGWKKNDFSYCGRHIVLVPGDHAWVRQEAFCGAICLTRPDQERRAQLDSPLTAAEKTEFQSCIGSLQWIGGNTRPAVQAATSLLQGSMPTVEALLKAQALLRECKASPEVGIKVVAVNLEDAAIVNFADGSWANWIYYMHGKRSSLGARRRGFALGLEVPSPQAELTLHVVCRGNGFEGGQQRGDVDPGDDARGGFPRLPRHGLRARRQGRARRGRESLAASCGYRRE